MDNIRLSTTVVNVTTLSEFREALKWHQRRNYIWADGRQPLKDIEVCFNVTKENTCIELLNKFTFGDKSYFESEGYTILTLAEFQELVKNRRI